jgi:anti-anti-sigma factor
MHGYGHLELLRYESVCVVRLPHQRPLCREEVDTFVAEWNLVADRPRCRTLVVDCSQIVVPSSEILSKLIVLRRRLKRKEGRLVLCGLRPQVREALNWTNLDRFFAIQEEAGQEAAMLDVCANAGREEALGVSASPQVYG